MTPPGTAPRFRDAHTHLASGAADLHDLDLRGVSSPSAIATAVERAARGAPTGGWIRGWGWDGISTPPDATPAHPVFLARKDGHAAWVNAAAGAALGVPRGERVVREAAFDGARLRLPERTDEERRAAIQSRLSEIVALGIAEVEDMVDPWAPALYAGFRDRGDLPVSVGLWLPETLAESDAGAIRRGLPPDDRSLAVRGIKLFLDGALEARTAALTQPYADDPGNRGELRIEEKEIPARVTRWASRGWPVALHAIGDRAVNLALDALAAVPRPAFGAHRIEHAQVVLRSDLPRFAEIGVLASLQPGHWHDDRPWLASRLGARPEAVVHPLASLGRAGAGIVLGSDWPVSSWDPARVLAAAVDPARAGEAADAAQASAWYTSAPR